MSPRLTKAQREAAERASWDAALARIAERTRKRQETGRKISEGVKRSQLFFSGVIVPREGPDAEEGGDEWQVVEDRTNEGGRGREPQA